MHEISVIYFMATDMPKKCVQISEIGLTSGSAIMLVCCDRESRAGLMGRDSLSVNRDHVTRGSSAQTGLL